MKPTIETSFSSGRRVNAYPEAASSSELRRLAAWYRSFAEKAGDTAIWEKRLLTAEQLEAEAVRVEQVNERRVMPGGRDRD